MGEYAEYAFRQYARTQLGFDPGEGCLTVRDERPKQKKVNCKICGRHVAEIGLSQHMKAKHE